MRTVKFVPHLSHWNWSFNGQYMVPMFVDTGLQIWLVNSTQMSQEVMEVWQWVQHVQHQDPETEAAKLNVDIFNFYIYICAFPVVTCQNVFSENGLSRTGDFCSETLRVVSVNVVTVQYGHRSYGAQPWQPLTPTPHKHWCYLLRFLCLMINRFSSVGYIGSAWCLLPAILRPRYLFFLPLAPSSCFDSDRCIPPATFQRRRSGLPSRCPSTFVFFIFFPLLFFWAEFSPLPRPLGKSAASSKMIFLDGRGSLEVGTGLLAFHRFTLPVLCGCWYLLSFVLGVSSLKSLSLKNIWLELGLWLLGVWWGVWLFLWCPTFGFFFGGPGVTGVWQVLVKQPFFFNSLTFSLVLCCLRLMSSTVS